MCSVLTFDDFEKITKNDRILTSTVSIRNIIPRRVDNRDKVNISKPMDTHTDFLWTFWSSSNDAFFKLKIQNN